MNPVNSYIQTRLNQRHESQSFRGLNTDKSLIDFCSNDYIGFARSEELQAQIDSILKSHDEFASGSTGSRLISGNSEFTEILEAEIASFHRAEASLIFNSGYDANLGLFASLPQKGDTIITDELIHASIIDGARLSFANRFSFKHNDLQSLEEKLKVAKGKIFIAVESVYSMDGDEAPLKEIVTLAEKFSAAVIVDEAHAVGVFGDHGKGLVKALGLEDKVFARLVTFGKALGCHGAAILGSSQLRSYLINFARSFIYTTAASPYTHVSVKASYQLLAARDYQSDASEKVNLFRQETGNLYQSFVNSNSPIQCLLIPGNENARKLASSLQNDGFNVRAILHPTVPEGKERLRICLHTFNTDEEIRSLIQQLKKHL